MGQPEAEQTQPEAAPQTEASGPQSIPGIHRVIAVSSGKGGVGKTTVAANIATALAKRGARVGLMDADVYGPDIPIMFGVHSTPSITQDERVVPLEAHGVKLMSIGFLLEVPKQAIVWRGPMLHGALQQLNLTIVLGQ